MGECARLGGCQPRRAIGRAHTPVQGLCSVHSAHGQGAQGAAHRVGARERAPWLGRGLGQVTTMVAPCSEGE